MSFNAVSRNRHASSSIVKQVLQIIFSQQQNNSGLAHNEANRVLPLESQLESSGCFSEKKQ